MQQINAGDKCRSVRAKDLSDDTIISEVAVVLVNCQCKYQTSHQCHHRHPPAKPVGDYEVPQETGSKVLIAGIAQYRRWLLYELPSFDRLGQGPFIIAPRACGSIRRGPLIWCTSRSLNETKRAQWKGQQELITMLGFAALAGIQPFKPSSGFGLSFRRLWPRLLSR